MLQSNIVKTATKKIYYFEAFKIYHTSMKIFHLLNMNNNFAKH